MEYGTEAVPDSVRVVNPAWRHLDSQVRGLTGKRQYLLVQFAAQSLQRELSEAKVTGYQQKKAQLQEEIEHLAKQLDQIKQHSVSRPLIMARSESCRKQNTSLACSRSANTFSTPSS